MKKTSYIAIVTALFFTVLLSLAIKTAPAAAQTQESSHTVYIHIFWGEGCPHCAKAIPWLEGLSQDDENIVILEYEIYSNEDNRNNLFLLADEYSLTNLGVPTIFIGPYIFQGFVEADKVKIEDAIRTCEANGCVDEAGNILTGVPSPTRTPTAVESTEIISTVEPNENSTVSDTNTLEVPIFGKVNLENKSIFLSTALIAFVDGVNPCSIWVLTMLLALTLHTGSRKKVFLIGFVFLTVTAGIYALFILGLFSVLKFAGFLNWIRVVIAVVALVFSIINIKDYFWYKEGLSLTIADDKKPVMFKQMRSLTDASQSTWGLIGATIVFAAGVSLIEFSCTAGFPVIWVNLLSAQKVSGVLFILLLLIYMLIYQADELVIFLSSVATLKAGKIEEKSGRILKLVSGVLMFVLAAVMIFNPELMNNMASSLLVFVAAFLATIIILILHRYILPHFGIQIGSEFSSPTQKRKKKSNDKRKR